MELTRTQDWTPEQIEALVAGWQKTIGFMVGPVGSEEQVAEVMDVLNDMEEDPGTDPGQVVEGAEYRAFDVDFGDERWVLVGLGRMVTDGGANPAGVSDHPGGEPAGVSPDGVGEAETTG